MDDRSGNDPAAKAEDDSAKLDNWFSYHAPIGDQGERYERLRAGAKAYAQLIVELCPPSADRTVAIRKLREAVYSANASIACGGR